MNEYDVTQYVIPENTVVIFNPLFAQSKIIIKLLSGSADLLYNNTAARLPLEEYELPLRENLYPRLRSNTPCSFILRGNHYLGRAIQMMSDNERMLFQVTQFDNSSFVMEKDTQLQIFVIEDDESDVRITCAEGNCQILGQNIPKEYGLRLTPCSTFVVSSRNNEKYSVGVSGIRRRIKVSLSDVQSLRCMRSVQHLIQTECSLAKTVGPTFLIIGPTNTGKTSFCHSLLNGAIDDGMNPVYINLDIRRCIPGTIGLRTILCRIRDVVGFAHYFQSLLHFGNAFLNSNTFQLYYLLVRKMGELLTQHQSSKYAEYSSPSPTIIDMCGMLGLDKITIECVLQSFTVRRIIYIGNNRNEYENFTKALPSAVETDFVPAPEDIEPQSERWEANYVDFKIREYFYGEMKRPDTPNHFVVEIENLRVYRVVTESDDFEMVNARSDDFLVERISCGPNLENYLLAFMGDGDLNEHNLAAAEMKYYVCFETVDFNTNTVTVLAPGYRSFKAGVLLISNLQLR